MEDQLFLGVLLPLEEQLFLEEAADLVFHLLILLKSRGYSARDVFEVLKKREK